ncbi:MAG: Outer membrane protein assembly factor BamB precursor [Candidatus Accumulibacter sp. BA-94]|nr:MAG: Outer membrane protein assembly factor BamB precursor [Candidatus Accumulibacter sp. BA-94]
MKRRVFALLLPVLLAGCSTLESLNPFSSSGPKMAELQPIQASAQARVVWQESVGKGGPYAFVPAVVGSSVYAAGRDGTIARFDDGRPVWRIKTEQPLSGGVGADERLLAVGTAKGDILAFAAADGKLLWEAKASSEVLAPPAVAGGLVIVRSGDHRLAAYDAAGGTRKWIYQRPNPALSVRVTAAPVVVEKYVFAGFPGGKLIAVNADNGAPLWEGTVALPKGATELDRIADVSSVPVIDARMICAVAFQGRVSCFDLGSGNLIWARDISSAAGLSIDSRYVYVADDQGAVHALDKASGASIWKQDKLFLRRLTAPLASGGLVAVADVQGVVHLLSRDDGSFAARLSTDGKPVVAPLQRIGKNLLVQTSGGGLYAIEAQ